MMNSVNVIGRVASDVEIKDVAGQSVATFSVASNNKRKDKNTGEYGTNFYRVSAWGHLSDTASRFLKKGHRVGISGDLIIRDYIGSDGAKRTAVEIDAKDITLIETKAEAEAKSGSASAAPAAAAPQGFTAVENDELPF